MKLSMVVIIITLMSHQVTKGQTFSVSDVKKCFYLNGSHVQKNDTLTLDSKFKISKNGKIDLSFLNQWGISRDKEGIYSVDTIYQNLKRLKDFNHVDSIYLVLKRNGIEKCKFNYKYSSRSKRLADGSLVKWTDLDDIEIKNNSRIETTDPSVTIQWDYPIDYTGKYFVLLTDMFGGYIDIVSTSDKSIVLDLRKFKDRQQVIMYKVISGECRESNSATIVVK